MDANTVEIIVKIAEQAQEIAQAVHLGKSLEDTGAGWTLLTILYTFSAR